MDFTLSDSQRALQDTARKYAREVIRPKAAHYDETAEFPWDILRSTYFTAKWDRAAARHLAQWAEKHGIGVAIEGHNAGSDTWIRFSVPDQRSP